MQSLACVRSLHVCYSVPAAGGWRLVAEPRGALANLRTEPTGEQPPAKGGTIRLAVSAVGLNFRDVLNVLGMYPGNPGPPGDSPRKPSPIMNLQVTIVAITNTWYAAPLLLCRRAGSVTEGRMRPHEQCILSCKAYTLSHLTSSLLCFA